MEWLVKEDSIANKLETPGLLDSSEDIEKKLKSAVTDSDGVVAFDEANKPGVSNLLVIEASLTNQSIDDLVKKYDGLGYVAFKAGVAESVIGHLTPIQERYNELFESDQLDDILDAGAEKANTIASATLKAMEDAMGLGRTRRK